MLKRTLALALIAPLTFAQQAQRLTHAGAGPDGAPQTTFVAHQLGNDHAEGITSIDMDGDGVVDLVSGAYWYKNPGVKGGDWVRHQFRTVGTLNEFVSDCGEWAVDVNHDGLVDVVTTGWMLNGINWYEHPKDPTAMWTEHRITDSYDTEGGAMADINGDGVPDVVVAHYRASSITWIDFSGATPRVHHAGGPEADGHGVGVGDVDGDGKADLLTPHGWFRNIDANADKWEWHADWQLGDAGFPILTYDVNGDGKPDVIYGQGHSYGLYWLEQTGSNATRTWVKHTIDESFSQVHALKLVDIDGDGKPELVAGKRYRGHDGRDPGSYDPIVLYYYTIDTKAAKFTRYPIAVNSAAGAGTQFVVQDLDGDGDVDIAAAGKSGVFFHENLRVNTVANATRETQILINKQWPFEGEGPVVKQEDLPKPAATLP